MLKVKDLFIHLEADQIIYFETFAGGYIEHGVASRIWKKYADCPVLTIHCRNPYKSLFVRITNPEGRKVFKMQENGLWN